MPSRLFSEDRMSNQFCIFSAVAQGWLTKQSTYSSDVKDALQMTEEKAFELCRRHRRANNELRYIPVPLYVVEGLLND